MMNVQLIFNFYWSSNWYSFHTGPETDSKPTPVMDPDTETILALKRMPIP